MTEEKQGGLQEGLKGPPASKYRQGRRRRRRDYGSFRPSQRDIELLELIEEQYAITLPQLARLMGRSPETARALRDRWKRARWVDSRKLAVAAPSFVWLTRRAPVEHRFRRWEPRHGLALHIEAITEVRLLLERDLRLGEWECERSIAQRLALTRNRRAHLPDGVLDTGRERIAIEVELTLKTRERLETIIRELSYAYDRVWYFAPTPLASKLEAIVARSPWRNVRVHEHPPRHTDIAELSTTARPATADWVTAAARADDPTSRDPDWPMEPGL